MTDSTTKPVARQCEQCGMIIVRPDCQWCSGSMFPTLFDMPSEILPVLPYGGTSGWSGSQASAERAITADSSGTTNERQQKVMAELAHRRDIGLTWVDLERLYGWHHGIASGVLSVLHKVGLINRLTEKRAKCSVYVLPEWTQGRATAAHRPNVSARLLMEILGEIEDDLQNDRIALAMARIAATREALQ
jgi:hypothetical protein